jgi:hypothetical protein
VLAFRQGNRPGRRRQALLVQHGIERPARAIEHLRMHDGRALRVLQKDILVKLLPGTDPGLRDLDVLADGETGHLGRM